ncbi:flagellar biosynthetic protein FliR [Tistlia consotensis]|uniref:Flagellar biosynthetic protein FliR n=1 Tax=Tistlia consotensis USBA 355 TaxID=560819 RepID=A0A1Y6CQG8_9PROT|nr:flagellar biosynthetic protein FliR [Tistlia consotensis]SMF68171.1 flagellar biosynthetic protein FliR [Tistlia consotensis USBA 355]SNR98898.1 flagellar biosynthetic protein FliR [Tistlia consotensis]
MIEDLLPATIFSFLLVFARVGSVVMLIPGIGESYVPARVRLGFAVMLSLLVVPLVSAKLPPAPAAPVSLVVLLLGEIVVGLFLGAIARILLVALGSAGMIIANMTSLANAMVNNLTSQQQGSIAGNFLSLTGLLMVFTLDLHHLSIRAAVDSYMIFPVGGHLPVGDFSETISRMAGESFLLAMKMASPVIATAGIFYLGLGLLARLMPQVQIFFIAIPLQISLGLLVLGLSLPIVMRVFLSSYESHLLFFVAH